MLFLLTLLLAALAFGVGGIAIPSTTNITSLTTSNATASLIANQILIGDLDGCADIEQDCGCFGYNGQTYGITREHMINAMNNACMKFTGGQGDAVSMYGQGEGLVKGKSDQPTNQPYHLPICTTHLTNLPFAERTSYYLYRATHNNEEGQVAVTIHVKWDADACAGPLPISWEYCWDQLHHPLDGCNTGSENGKRGGVIYHDCVYWVLDPNPRVNYPYEGLIG